MQRFVLKCFVATLLIFGLIEVFDALPPLGFLDPIELAFKDFELTDVVFSKLNDNRPARIDTNIVIVNLGTLSRGGVAAVINTLSGYHPAVIGVDALFWKEDTSAETKFLVHTVQSTPQLVMSSRLEYAPDSEEGELSDSVVGIHNAIAGADLSKVEHGYVNFNNDESSVRTIRSWQPATIVGTDTVQSFALRLLTKYAGQKGFTIPFPRSEWCALQTINYQKQQSELRLEGTDVLNPAFDKSFIQGKIVLVGFMGATLADSTNYEDSFFSPLNEQYAGKSLPDIHGIEIHKNCISMALHNDLITEPSTTAIWIGSFLLCFLNILLFASVEDHLPFFYDLICKLVQLVEAIGLLILSIYVFQIARLKLDASLAVLAVVLSSDIFAIYNSALEAVASKWEASKERKRLLQNPESIVPETMGAVPVAHTINELQQPTTNTGDQQ
ncbi:MAG: CHASE2 domain-containing protein [Candidatus Kapabacteria bacterium]|nr:CHASE2 domain-containing protein [Candidatus Kapabacteria bacterium]